MIFNPELSSKDMREGNELYVMYLMGDNKRPYEVNGPFFYDEISSQKELLYDMDEEQESPLIMPQELFRSIYTEEYVNFFQDFWFECINGYLARNSKWLGEYNYEPTIYCLYNDLFIIYPCTNDPEALHISFAMGADPFVTGRMFKELVEYSEMTILIDQPFYQDPLSGVSYTGMKAAQKYIANKSLQPNLLN